MPDFVRLRHETHGEEADFPASAVESAATRGWHPTDQEPPAEDPPMTDDPGDAGESEQDDG